jgi:tetratricopeptide (TPR) repeat protein
MDSEHRHELKQNELARIVSELPDMIRHLPTLIKENLWTTCCVVIIIVAIFMWIGKLGGDSYVRNVQKQAELTSYYQSIDTAKAKLQSGEGDFSVITNSVESIQAAAKNAETAGHEAIALIEAADGIRSGLHYRTDAVTDQEIKGTIVKAQEKYKIALKKAGDYALAAAMAEFGIALCEEEMRNFDEAIKGYEAIIANEDYAVTGIPEQARNRLMFIDDYKKSFTFVQPAPEPEPAEETAAEPAAE